MTNKKYYIYKVKSNADLELEFNYTENIDIYAFERYSNKSVSKLNSLKKVISLNINLLTYKVDDDSEVNINFDITNILTNLQSKPLSLLSLNDSKTGRKYLDMKTELGDPDKLVLNIKTKQLEQANGSEVIILIRKNIDKYILPA